MHVHDISKELFNQIDLICGLASLSQLWSCIDIASVLWDFYTTLGCHDTQNELKNITKYTNKAYIYTVDGLN